MFAADTPARESVEQLVDAVAEGVRAREVNRVVGADADDNHMRRDLIHLRQLVVHHIADPRARPRDHLHIEGVTTPGLNQAIADLRRQRRAGTRGTDAGGGRVTQPQHAHDSVRRAIGRRERGRERRHVGSLDVDAATRQLRFGHQHRQR